MKNIRRISSTLANVDLFKQVGTHPNNSPLLLLASLAVALAMERDVESSFRARKLAANHCYRLILFNPNQRRVHHGAIKVLSDGLRQEFLTFVLESFQPTARSV